MLGNAPGETAPVFASFPIPAFSTSPYLNTGSDARYIGTAACAACHPNNEASYRLTPHSRALADIDLAREPADGAFDHPLSGRSYHVYRKDGKLHHEEVVRTEDGREIARLDHPIRYVIGSGHFTRSYLVEVDGFLYESPITWYSARQKWDMSPGYDIAHHGSFERPVALGCVGCHAGRAEEVAGAYHKLTFHELAIGCENCHGPGSLHRDVQHTRKSKPGETDLTIVHPGKLSRSLLESICADCHHSTAATVAVRGRDAHDFRPGRPLSDFRIHYRFAGGGDQMTVVGHVEQLRQSACYQKSPGLTCITCHDPHRVEPVKDAAAFYRDKCLTCHQASSCKVERGVRIERERDNCIACHMPRGDTEIPHIAFTHHRIGRHNAGAVKRVAAVSDLVTDDALSHLGPQDRDRNLGLAYFKLSRSSSYSVYADTFRWRALTLLEGVAWAGLHDGEIDMTLAELCAESNSARAAQLARHVLEQPSAPILRMRALPILFDRDYRGAQLPRGDQVASGIGPSAADPRGLARTWACATCDRTTFRTRCRRSRPLLPSVLTARPSMRDSRNCIAGKVMSSEPRSIGRKHAGSWRTINSSGGPNATCASDWSLAGRQQPPHPLMLHNHEKSL